MKEFENSSVGNYADDLLQTLLNDPYVVALMQQKGFDKEVVRKNLISFSVWRERCENCIHCTGLETCNNHPEGYRYDIDENLYDELVPCHYLMTRKKQLKHKDNYLICDLSEKNLTTSLSKINLENESRYYKDIVELLMQWLEEKPQLGFYIHGGLGVGKSYLAASVCNDLAREGKRVAFVNFPRLCTDIRNNVSEKNFVDDKIRKMRNAYLLVLDDIGAENMTSYIRDDILFTVLDYRMENGKRTMFTSNCNIDRLAARWTLNRNGDEDQLKAARVIERIKTLISCELPIDGKSRRGN